MINISYYYIKNFQNKFYFFLLIYIIFFRFRVSDLKSVEFLSNFLKTIMDDNFFHKKIKKLNDA